MQMTAPHFPAACLHCCCRHSQLLVLLLALPLLRLARVMGWGRTGRQLAAAGKRTKPLAHKGYIAHAQALSTKQT
jgi:hypothetical protein